jgi:CMP-N-acetylneuraminic acid synthetase
MKNITIIPARGGSKRLPQKNVQLLGGIPLIAQSILDAKEFPDFVHTVYVSTDYTQIKNIALTYGAKVIDRPIQISGDHEPTVSALKHVLESLENPVDWVFLMHPTNPIRPQGLLSEAFQSMQGRGADSLMTVARNHQKFGTIVNDVFVPFNYTVGQRSQDLQPLYFENGLLYIIASDLVLQERIMETKPFPMVVNHPFASVDIIVWEDLVYANYLYELSNIPE